MDPLNLGLLYSSGSISQNLRPSSKKYYVWFRKFSITGSAVNALYLSYSNISKTSIDANGSSSSVDSAKDLAIQNGNLTLWPYSRFASKWVTAAGSKNPPLNI